MGVLYAGDNDMKIHDIECVLQINLGCLLSDTPIDDFVLGIRSTRIDLHIHRIIIADRVWHRYDNFL